MRATIVFLFALLAFVVVAAHEAAEVRIYFNTLCHFVVLCQLYMDGAGWYCQSARTSVGVRTFELHSVSIAQYTKHILILKM